MSHDLYLAPPRDFLDWTEQQWQAFFDRDPEMEQLGNASYITLVEEAITHNLEGDREGSRYPMLFRRRTEDVIGWYAEDIAQLSDEIRSIHAGLAALPINRSTLMFDSDDDVRQLIERFRKRDRARPLNNLYDLCRHYIDTFEQMIEKARATGQGLWLSF